MFSRICQVLPDVRIGTKSKVEYLSDLKACMRRKFVISSSDRKGSLEKK